MKKIKKSLIILLVAIAIFFLPLFPLFFIEPVHVGKDPNIYSAFGNGYQQFLIGFGGFIWARAVARLTKAFLEGVIINDEQDEDEK
jgi:hypothetical protein